MNWSFLKKSRVIICFCLVVFYSFFDGFSFSGGPTDPATGLPPFGNCSKCHSGVTNAGPGQIKLNVPSFYIPGSVYPIEVKVIQRGAPKFGFQATIVNSQNLFVGQFDTTGSDSKCQLVFNDTSLITHTNQSHRINGPDSAVYTFFWKAPAANVGQVKMYVSAVGANNDFLMGNDSVISTTAIIPVFTSSVSSTELKPLALFPSVNNGSFNVQSVESEPAIVSIRITDITGNVVFAKTSNQKTGAYFESLQLNLTPGVYTATLMHGAVVKTSKMIVQ